VADKKRRFRLASKAALKRLGVLFLLILAGLIYGYCAMIPMPGHSFRGPLPTLTESQKLLAEELRGYVDHLANAEGGVGRVGNRSTFYPKRFAESAAYLDDTLASFGYATRAQTFVERGARTPNLKVTVPGTTRASEIVVIGAHYDAFQGSPGADDNASGVAACMVYARRLQATPQPRTIRFVFLVNEEPPAFWTPDMGSWVYAKACRARGDNIVAMISLESIGYYSDKAGSQKYPSPMNLLYPDTGNFIAFVGNYSSRSLVRRCIKTFRTTTQFPSEGGAPPAVIPGVGWSDQWSFWQEGYRAIMITDTATFRNPWYHTPQDRPATLDYERMARVVEGVERVILDLAADK